MLHVGVFLLKLKTLQETRQAFFTSSIFADGSSSDSGQNNDSAKEPLKKKDKKKNKTTGFTYTGPGGQPLSKDVINSLSQFTRKQRKGTIDVWWLYDDGGEVIRLLS